jgi:hypothetical protein
MRAISIAVEIASAAIPDPKMMGEIVFIFPVYGQQVSVNQMQI